MSDGNLDWLGGLLAIGALIVTAVIAVFTSGRKPRQNFEGYMTDEEPLPEETCCLCGAEATVKTVLQEDDGWFRKGKKITKYWCAPCFRGIAPRWTEFM